MKFNFNRAKSFLRYPSLTHLSGDARVMETARIVVRYYYYILPFVSFSLYFDLMAPGRPNFQPLWPLFWISHFTSDYGITANIIRFLFLATTLVGIFAYRHRIGRAVVFFGIWQMHAFESSFGSMNHQWYMWLWTSFIFIFLPDILDSVKTAERRRSFLLVIWWAQANVMLLYTMAGAEKLYMVIQQYVHGEVNGFSINGFAYQIADWLPQLQNTAVLGPVIIAHPIWGWPFYVCLHFLQFFALWTMVRTSLQKIWAFMLVLFHIGTYLTMGIEFQPFIPLLIVLFFNSPFVKENITLMDFVIDLPIIGQIVEWTRAKMSQKSAAAV